MAAVYFTLQNGGSACGGQERAFRFTVVSFY